ncbi:MAG: hypothetical protein HYS35_05295 [Betaproteobacteria bacterium]|nr:hypothetical protein [Betaproteobacteria bacterium]
MAGRSFLPVFDAEYADKLGLRSETLRKAFEILEAMDKGRYSIVETGCARKDDWYGDGQSTLLFDRFVNHWDGAVRTVDIDPLACERLRARVSGKVTISCGDSVAYLRSLLGNEELHVDLLYLDSYDLDWRNPHPAALHHLHELCAVMPLLAGGTLVMVDDTARNQAFITLKGREMVVHDFGVAGKGGYVAEFFAKIGCAPVIEGYQHGWIMP